MWGQVLRQRQKEWQRGDLFWTFPRPYVPSDPGGRQGEKEGRLTELCEVHRGTMTEQKSPKTPTKREAQPSPRPQRRPDPGPLHPKQVRERRRISLCSSLSARSLRPQPWAGIPGSIQEREHFTPTRPSPFILITLILLSKMVPRCINRPISGIVSI